MSDTTPFCPHCGTSLEAAAEVCPACGAALTEAAAANQPKGFAAVAASLTSKPWYWIGGAAVVAGVVAALVFGGLFGPSGKAICTAELNQARTFGVLAPSATLASTSAKSTDVKNRKSCTAQVGEELYTLTADIKALDYKQQRCRDYVKQDGCIALYSVVRNDGMTTYQMREIPPGDTDDALAAQGILGAPQAPATNSDASGGAAPATPAASGLDADTAVDNSSSPQTAPAPAESQPAPSPDQQQ